MEQKRRFKSRLGKWMAGVALCIIPALVTGCNGTTGGGPFGGVTQNGTYNGTSANLGANRTGTLLLRTFSNNTINGTLTVTATALVRNATSGNALVVLPAGGYNFTGTRTGNSFTGTGTIPGTNHTFNINGTLSTSTTTGGFTITGTLNGEAFEFGGSIAVFTGGGGGGGGGNGSFAFTGNTGNANAASFSALAGTGTSIIVGGNRLLSATFASATSATNLRNITINVTSSSQFGVGDTFPLAEAEDPAVGQGVVIYGEGVPTNKAWVSNGGQVKITAIEGNVYTLQLINATMEVAPLAGPGQTNQATGTFTLNGSGNATIPTIVAP